MSDKSEAKRTVRDNDVVTIEYTLKVDGEVVDSSEQHGPLSYIHGQGHIIPGLEKELQGMAVGESKEVTVSPEEGYGVEDPNAFIALPKSEFPPTITLEPGVQLQLSDQSGQVYNATIHEVKDDSVVLNFNHPLAGKTLHFTVKVVGLREATPEELAHGHVHSEGDHHH
ncbi:MAG: peptidylprolyl isomerase [Chloroflexi bacterium]|nr:peptidylprolyl isomerase [Chloroflexota bacterium]